MDIYFALQSDSDGTPLLNQAANTTVYISKDGGSYAATTNAVVEIGRGSYKVTLTSAEATFTDVLLYQPVCTGAQTNTLAIEKPTDVSGLATTSDLSAVASDVTDIKAKTDALPEHPAAVGSEMALTSAAIAAAQSGLATSEALSTVDGVVDAIKTKTDNLPASPAAVGSEMALTSSTIASVKDGLATISATDALAGGLDTLASYGDAHWTTAAGFATPSDVAAAVEAIVAALPSDYAKTTDVSSAQTALTALINSVLSGIFHWQVEGSILTIYNASNVAIGAYTLTKDSSGNITAVTPIVQPEPETNNAE